MRKSNRERRNSICDRKSSNSSNSTNLNKMCDHQIEASESDKNVELNTIPNWLGKSGTSQNNYLSPQIHPAVKEQIKGEHLKGCSSQQAVEEHAVQIADRQSGHSDLRKRWNQISLKNQTEHDQADDELGGISGHELPAHSFGSRILVAIYDGGHKQKVQQLTERCKTLSYFNRTCDSNTMHTF